MFDDFFDYYEEDNMYDPAVCPYCDRDGLCTYTWEECEYHQRGEL